MIDIPIPLARVEDAIANNTMITCHEFHGSDNCLTDFIPLRIIRTSASMSMTYLPIHLIPFLLFKRKKLAQNPGEEIKKFITAFVKSLLFAGGYTTLLSYFLCKLKNISGDMNGTYVPSTAAFLAGASLLFENDTRRQEIALFLVPKVMESLYSLLRRRGLISPIKGAQEALFGLATSILFYFYLNSPGSIKAGYYSLMKKFIGEEI